jgi:DNA primase small subunit
MPHSVSPEAQEPDVEPMVTDVEVNEDASEHGEEDQDHEMAMIETSGEPADVVEDSAPAAAIEKQEVKLEDLFADVESDEEFPSSNAKDIKMSSSPEAPASPMSVLKGVILLLQANSSYRNLGPSARPSDPQVMRSFYQRLFPWRYLFQWLNHSPIPSNDFGHREFAFTLQNDAYLRYQSFPTADL